MSKTVVYEVDVMFGDCDPAGIVFFPNFSKWMDASSLNFFVKCGVPPWRELVKTRGIIGTPCWKSTPSSCARPPTANACRCTPASSNGATRS
jgi:hypothetical protein